MNTVWLFQVSNFTSIRPSFPPACLPLHHPVSSQQGMTPSSIRNQSERFLLRENFAKLRPQTLIESERRGPSQSISDRLLALVQSGFDGQSSSIGGGPNKRNTKQEDAPSLRKRERKLGVLAGFSEWSGHRNSKKRSKSDCAPPSNQSIETERPGSSRSGTDDAETPPRVIGYWKKTERGERSIGKEKTCAPWIRAVLLGGGLEEIEGRERGAD